VSGTSPETGWVVGCWSWRYPRDFSLAANSVQTVVKRVASAVVGASSVAQLDDNLAALDHLAFTPAELAEIDRFAVEGGVNLWAESSNA